jgi:hypothetical protein
MAVFLTELKTGPKPQEERMEEAKAISDLLVKEVIPFVDSRYRTDPNAESRAIMASLATGYDGIHTVFNHPGVLGGIALQSIMIFENEMNELIPHDAKYPLSVYLDWGLYDARSYAAGWDLGRINRKFDAFLRERGYRPAGGEASTSTTDVSLTPTTCSCSSPAVAASTRSLSHHGAPVRTRTERSPSRSSVSC